MAQERLEALPDHLDLIKTNTEGLKTVGLIYNPKNTSVEGMKVSVSTLALPATSGPALIQNARTVLGRVEAVYLIKGDLVTKDKFATFIAKQAAKKGVAVFTNDPGLDGIKGIRLIEPGSAGSFVVK